MLLVIAAAGQKAPTGGASRPYRVWRHGQLKLTDVSFVDNTIVEICGA